MCLKLPVDISENCQEWQSNSTHRSLFEMPLLTSTPGSAVVGFVLCTFPSIHYHVLLTATACFGATAFILGVDCYTTAGLKEVGYRVRAPQFVIDSCVVLCLQSWL
jgi:hypothetical protein